jgi:hypothetical protein
MIRGFKVKMRQAINDMGRIAEKIFVRKKNENRSSLNNVTLIGQMQKSMS